MNLLETLKASDKTRIEGDCACPKGLPVLKEDEIESTAPQPGTITVYVAEA